MPPKMDPAAPKDATPPFFSRPPKDEIASLKQSGKSTAISRAVESAAVALERGEESGEAAEGESVAQASASAVENDKDDDESDEDIVLVDSSIGQNKTWTKRGGKEEVDGMEDPYE